MIKLKYFQLTEDLKGQILSGQILPGEKIPSENTLAKEYGVSRQTVRKAIAILQSQGYVYAQHGRGTFCSELARHIHSSRNIAVVTTYLSDYIFPRVIQGIDEVLTGEGYSIILKNTRNSRSREARCLEELLQKDIDGMIIEPSKSQIYCSHTALYRKLEEYRIPYVFIQGCFEQMRDKPAVLMDDCKGGYLITKYLLELGHKHIVGVFKADDSQGQHRHKGYVKALQEAGVSYDPDRVVWFYTEDRSMHPYERICQMAVQGEQMDGVVCYNDQIALKVIHALEECGKKVPGDVSVTGYDNSYMANAGGITLTTITHPQEKLGEMAAGLLLSLVQEKEISGEGRRVVIEPELVIGNSCKDRRGEKENFYKI